MQDMSSPFQNFLAVPLHGSSVCHAHTTAFFFAIFRIPILSKSISSIQYNLLFRTAGFLFLRVRRGLNNACARVHYTPRGGVRRSYRRPCRGSSAGTDRRSRNNQRRPEPQEPETVCTYPATAGARRSAQERRRTSTVQNARISSSTPQIAPQGFTWYGIPCGEQNAAEQPESAGERKPGNSRRGLHTTVIS